MKSLSNRIGTTLGALGVACCLTLAAMPATTAEPVTAQSLIDRQMILDQITRYYYNFGRATKTPETDFYTDDAVLILGTTRREGKAAIAGAYGRPAAPPAGGAAAAGAPAAGRAPAAPAAAPPAPRPAAPPPAAATTAAGAPCPASTTPARTGPTPFNVTVDNPLIIVHGDTATSEVVFTEYRTQTVDCKPKLVFTTQGKEFATWVKVKGQWLYKSRQITGESTPPDGWKE
jgi:hypothetical protein